MVFLVHGRRQGLHLGVLLPLVAVVVLRTVSRSEAAMKIPFREIALLRRLPLFAPVPAPALEAAAAALVRVDVPAGEAAPRRRPNEGPTGRRAAVSGRPSAVCGTQRRSWRPRRRPLSQPAGNRTSGSRTRNDGPPG